MIACEVVPLGIVLLVFANIFVAGVLGWQLGRLFK